MAQIWIARLDRLSQIGRDVLSKEEMARADALRDPTHRRRYIASHAALRRILGSTLSCEPSCVPFAMGAAGKPMLANTALHFNMSRSEDVALIAVSERGAVGVDVERLRPMPDATDLARAYFAGPAREAIAAASLDARDKVFLMQWTRLEAIVKADGGGLGASPSIVDVPFSDDDKMVRMRNREWGLQSFVPVDGYVAAFASDGGRESFGFLDAV